MKKRYAVALAAAAAGAAAVLSTSPASAATQVGVSGQVCVYVDSDFGGNFLCQNSGVSIPDLAPYGVNGVTINDKVSSIANDTGIAYCFYSDANFGGSVWHFAPGQVANVTPGDVISSFQPCP